MDTEVHNAFKAMLEAIAFASKAIKEHNAEPAAQMEGQVINALHRHHS